MSRNSVLSLYLEHCWSLIRLALWYFVLQVVFRVYELIILITLDTLDGAQSSVIFRALNYDAIFVFYSSLLLVPLLAFLAIKYWKLARLFMLVFLGLITFCNMALTQVFFANQTLLDGSIFMFSWAEILMTVGAEFGSVKWHNILLYVITIGGFAYFFVFFKKKMKLPLWGKIVLSILYLVVGLTGLLQFEFSNPRVREYNTVEEFQFAHNKVNFVLYDYIDYASSPRYEYEEVKLAISDLQSWSGSATYTNPVYPYRRKAVYKNVLGEYFTSFKGKPNIVMIICEGLSRNMIDDGRYRGFYPRIDQLIQNSLYWPNFISGAERTYGVLPNILGSTPLGTKKGFTYLKRIPKHDNLGKLLSDNGYDNRFFYNGWRGFDKADRMLMAGNFVGIYDRNKFDEWDLGPREASWGYGDHQLFEAGKKYLERNAPKGPYFHVYQTLSFHHPFELYKPQDNDYVKGKIDRNDLTPEVADVMDIKHDLFKVAHLVDRVVAGYIEYYKTRPEFENTIFIITGDHDAQSLPLDNDLERFRVPLIIWSPKLKSAQKFQQMCSHRDLAPSIAALLESYQCEFPKEVSWLGDGLRTNGPLFMDRVEPLCLFSKVLPSIIAENKLLIGDQAFEISENLDLSPVTSEKLRSQRMVLEKINDYVCVSNRLKP